MSLAASSENTLTTEDSVCISKEDAKLIKEDLKLGLICDSIMTEQHLRILNFKEMFRKAESKDLVHMNRVARLNKDVKSITTQRDILKKITFYGVPLALGAGLFVGILLAK